MKSQLMAYCMMATGAVLALIFAAGPLATSFKFQVLFGASLFLLALGVAFRRIGARKDALSGAAAGEVQQAQAALESLRNALKQAQTKSESITDMGHFHECVQEATQPPMRAFLEHRQSLLDAYGIGAFADLMIRFASVERAINRTLSASADGVEHEARACLKKASQRMEECMEASAVTDSSGA